MASALHEHPSGRTELDTIAWEFLRSEFAEHIYADWPIGRRVDAYLRHHAPIEFTDDGSMRDALVEQIMANIGRAHRAGILPSSPQHPS